MSEAGVRRAVVAAYESLLDGDVDPFVELFAPRIEWTESRGARVLRTIRGRAEVADRLRSRVADKTIELCGIALQPGSISADFRQPWWNDPSWLRRLASSVMGVTFTQTLTLGDAVERIDNVELITSLAPELQHQHDMFALLLDR